jgi:hypothetical protein
VLWYRKSFAIPAAWAGSAFWLDFEGSFRNTTIWVNGQRQMSHESGLCATFHFNSYHFNSFCFVFCVLCFVLCVMCYVLCVMCFVFCVLWFSFSFLFLMRGGGWFRFSFPCRGRLLLLSMQQILLTAKRLSSRMRSGRFSVVCLPHACQQTTENVNRPSLRGPT